MPGGALLQPGSARHQAREVDVETLQGALDRITYFNEENGYVVARILPEDGRGEYVTVVGNLPSATPGEVLRLGGEWTEHPQYGRQFKIETCEQIMPATLEGIRRYLGSGLIKGIGPALASRITEQFRLKTLDVIEEEPDRLTEVRGLGRKRVDAVTEAWQEQSQIRNLMVFLQGHGVTTHLGTKIYKEYGDEAIRVVTKNPFRLAEDVWGIGFHTADQIALSMGMPADAPARLRAGIEHVLDQASLQGHLFLPKGELLEATAELIEGDAQEIEPILSALISDERVVLEDSPEDSNMYLTPLNYAEVGAANRVRRLLVTSPMPYSSSMVEGALSDIEGRLQITLARSQRDAAITALRAPVLVLTGGPGTGKTTTVRAILALFQLLGKGVSLCAPTGRAAKRLSEVTGAEATTIHRLLEFSRTGGFKRDARRPLNLDALIVDEVSMVDTVLMNSLLRAVPDGSHVVMVGDVDQLPSVGPGSVLKDLIDSGRVPVIQLTEIFRQARDSQIITNAHRVNHGQMPELTGPPDRDFFFVECDDPEEACDTIFQLCGERLPRHYDVDPVWDMQVLSPMRRGTLGAENLNDRLQDMLNADGEIIPRAGQQYRVGDKVMQIVNNYDRDVFNGDIGQIVGADGGERSLTVRFPEKHVEYDLLDLSELVLAYATTVHKSQGNEYPVVVLPIHTQHYIMLQRNLLYTALTRAKRLAVLVGSRKALSIAVRNNQVAHRNTSLAQRLRAESVFASGAVWRA